MTTTTTTRDGGEAILEAFRNLGIDYIISSPGSEWAPVWEALARQQINETPGPRYVNCWHETLAVNIASGYTRVTGKMQAVLLHAGVGLLQGSMGIQGAVLGEVPMLVCSGEATSYGENPDIDPQPQWYRSLSVVGGPDRFANAFTKWSGKATSPHTLYEQLVRAGELAQRVPQGPTFMDIPIETMIHDWTPGNKMRTVAGAPKTRPADEDIVRAGRTGGAEQVAADYHRFGRPRGGGIQQPGGVGRTVRHSGGGIRGAVRQLPQEPPAVPGRPVGALPERRRPGDPGRQPRAVVSARSPGRSTPRWWRWAKPPSRNTWSIRTCSPTVTSRAT